MLLAANQVSDLIADGFMEESERVIVMGLLVSDPKLVTYVRALRKQPPQVVANFLRRRFPHSSA